MDFKDMPRLREENIPYYVQIYDIIYQLIQEGRLAEGDALPGENLLADYWNVSRSTVRAAVRKLKEDGYISKMQGKKTVVTGRLSRIRDSLNHIFNPCLCCCAEDITRVDAAFSLQAGGRLIGDLLGYGGKSFVTAVIDFSYFSGEACVAASVAIIPAELLEEKGISAGNEDALRKLALSGLYEQADRSRLSMSAVEWPEDAQDGLCCPVCIVMDEVFYQNGKALAYHKYRMDARRYRFAAERGR